MNDVQKTEIISKKEPRDYWLLNRYDGLIVENKSKLIYNIKGGVSTIQHYVADSDYFTYFMKFIWLLDDEDVIEYWKNFRPNAKTLHVVI